MGLHQDVNVQSDWSTHLERLEIDERRTSSQSLLDGEHSLRASEDQVSFCRRNKSLSEISNHDLSARSLSRIPKFSHQSLTEWFTSSSPTRVARALNYHARKVKTVLEILEKSELVFRTA